MIWSDAYAQAGGAQPQDPMSGLLLQIPYFLLIGLIFYLLLIRPQQQKQKQANEMLKRLKKGDRVLTGGGIYGTVLGVDDAKVVLKIADDTKVEFVKTAIVQVMGEEKKA